jgi:hypothetical protein
MSLSTYYTVSIANSTGAAPANGFVDHTKIEQYMAASSNPTTYAHSQAKERGNVRFQFIVEQLGRMANCYVTQMTATGASATAEADPFVFHVEVERGDSVLHTLDESNAGVTLTGSAALKRCVARALIESRTTNRDMYDPTLLATPGNSTQAARYGVREESLVIGPAAANLTAAETLITVTVL